MSDLFMDSSCLKRSCKTGVWIKCSSGVSLESAELWNIKMNNIQYIHVELVVFFSCSNCNKLLLNETVVKLMTWAKFQLLRFFFLHIKGYKL